MCTIVYTPTRWNVRLAHLMADNPYIPPRAHRGVACWLGIGIMGDHDGLTIFGRASRSGQAERSCRDYRERHTRRTPTRAHNSNPNAPSRASPLRVRAKRKRSVKRPRRSYTRIRPLPGPHATRHTAASHSHCAYFVTSLDPRHTHEHRFSMPHAACVHQAKRP